MTHDFHPEAREEYIEAAAWYEKQRTGLGDEFIAAVESAIALILCDPGRFSPVDGHFRIFRLKRFPYNLYFEHLSARQHIRIFAVAHHRRNTGYWHSRFET